MSRNMFVQERDVMKKIVFAIACSVASSVSMAAGENNIGSCGWGSKLLDGQSGVAPQVLAVTTNGTSGNQTFGITSGTSGCTQDGVVKSNWVTALFIEENKSKLARDMSRGYGETLDSLSKLMGVTEQDMPMFAQVTKNNFTTIFPSDQVTGKEISIALKQVLESDAELAVYSAVLI